MTTFLNLCSGGGILLSTIPGIFSLRFRIQKDDKLLSTIKRNHIELKIQELTQKLGLGKPIELIEKKGLTTGAQAQGVAFFSGRAGIAINPDLVDEISEEELEFLIAHELSHIKANDYISCNSTLCVLLGSFVHSIPIPSEKPLAIPREEKKEDSDC